MTPDQRRFGRRALLAGAAGVGALATYEVSRWGVDDPDHTTTPTAATAPTAPTQTSAVDESRRTVDLTVRWRHLERRVASATLLAGWQFDEGSGYAFDDVSGNDNPLFVTGSEWNTTDSGLASAIHRSGLRGGSVYLDGTRWLAAAPTTRLVSRSGLTISAWLRADSLPTETALLAGFDGSYALTLNAAGAITLAVTDRSGSRRTVHTPSGALTAGRWTQVTATASPVTGVLRVFVDGTSVSSAATPRFAMRVGPASLVVGDRLRGALDELTIHRVALSPAKVRRLYVVGLPKVYTQTSESVDAAREVFTRFKGSDPIPHPVVATTVLTHRFADSLETEQGSRPLGTPVTPVFVPGAFGGAWRVTSNQLGFVSPLTTDSGTFEAWYQAIADPQDPNRQRRKVMFTAVGPGSALVLYTESGRWQVDVRRRSGRTDTSSGPSQTLSPGTLEHVAVSWGAQEDGRHGVALYVNGVPAAFLATSAGETTYPNRVGLGGTTAAPTYALLDDVRICSEALPWGEICPRGQASTDAAGLDLRDRFDRPPEAAPMLWRGGSEQSTWSHRTMTWLRPAAVGADPDDARALFQSSPSGVRAAYHPDAFGYASSIEAGVAFPTDGVGWAGIFLQSPRPDEPFSGVTFMLSARGSRLRLARFQDGRVTASKVLPHDFPITPRSTYEMTLTSAGDGIVRGFVDGINVISMRAGDDWPDRGYAGMVTEGTQAFFSILHFCALTPAASESRVIRTRVLQYGEGAAVAALELVPFRWHKRRGLLPWHYTFKRPEPAGNIAGADTPAPPRPIAAAGWRSEDSANTDVITVDGRVLCFMRGNPRVDTRPSVARVGVLSRDVAKFDGVHFTDPNTPAAQLRGGTLLVSGSLHDAAVPTAPGSLQLNEPSTAYVGNGRVLFFGRESTVPEPGKARYGRLAYSRFDAGTAAWEHAAPQHVPWSDSGALTVTGPPVPGPRLRGTPEIVSLRSPDDDSYQAVVFQQTGPAGAAVMTTALLVNVSAGVPTLAPERPVRTSLSRASGEAIYGFRVMFDNGIYYLHYNDGAQVPDWPDRFVLAAALDPSDGPWLANAATTRPESTYFRRGGRFEPDNAAIWQGTMFKHRGRYYLYYENYHAVGDVDQEYADYANPDVGSRVGFATA